MTWIFITALRRAVRKPGLFHPLVRAYGDIRSHPGPCLFFCYPLCLSVQRTTDSLRLCAARENLTQAAEVRLCGAKNRRLPCLEQPLRRLRAVIVQPVSYMKTPVQMHRRFCGCRQTPFIPAGVAEQFLTTGWICFFFPKAAGRATIDKKDDAAIAARRAPI